MKTISDRDLETLVRCGKVLALRRYHSECTRTANAIRQIIKIAKKYERIQQRQPAAGSDAVLGL